MATHFEDGRKKTKCRLLAIKDENSYLIMSNRGHYKIIEKGIEVCEKKLTELQASCSLFVFYYKRMNCYFIIVEEFRLIYQKTISNKPLIDYMHLKSSKPRPIYSQKYQRLILINSSKNLYFVNLKTRKIEFRFQDLKTTRKKNLYDYKRGGLSISSYHLLEPDESRLLILTKTFYLQIFGLFDQKGSRSLLVNQKIAVYNSSNLHNIHPISAFSDNHYLVFFIFKWPHKFDSRDSKAIAVTIEGDEEVFVDPVFDFTPNNQTAIHYYSFRFLRRIGSHVLLVGLTSRQDGYISLFDYNTETSEFEEIIEKRVYEQVESSSFDLIRLRDDCFYYAGDGGSVMRLSLTS